MIYFNHHVAEQQLRWHRFTRNRQAMVHPQKGDLDGS